MNNPNTISLIIALIILFLSIIIIKLKRELNFHKMQEKELDHYSTEIEVVYNQMSGIRHDYRNHLQVIAAYIQAEQVDDLKSYVQSLTNELNQVDTIIRTGNTLIDAMVNTKLTKAKDKGINLHAQAIAPNQLNIEKVDLAIILGNLLNNALEATQLSSGSVDGEQAFIRLYIAPIKGNLYISITNSMAINPKSNFLSLKAPNRQGYGLRRIDQVVEKNNGIVNRNWENGIFATEITLPLNQ